ncbi:MAG: hypothetical protein EXX96DRAFT_533724 [Benjaminiella poitrasii]|nr:MAG: hypothetical protein EXX96DRAFT_533724 [Benjaminiella poitrasii]
MTNMLIDGDDRSKLPVIVFSDSMRNRDTVKVSGHLVSCIGVLHRILKRREKNGEVLVPDVNEYCSSQYGSGMSTPAKILAELPKMLLLAGLVQLSFAGHNNSIFNSHIAGSNPIAFNRL